MSEIVNIPNGEVIDWGLHKINAPLVWEYTKGKDVKVAILDTGCDNKHPDLAANIIAIRNFTNSSQGALDVRGHGTHVAGIVAAINNGIGMIGIAPESKLVIAKVLGDDGSGNYNHIIAGLEWAIEQDVDIINMSLGSSAQPPEQLHTAIQKAADKGIVIISATGNNNGEVCWPAQYDEAIAVSAVDQNDERASFSNYGIKNEIIAPGVDILSTFPNNKYAKLSGTSMATPIISGAAALFISHYKEMHGHRPSRQEVYEALMNATEDLGATGRDDQYGVGRINLLKLFD